MKVFSTFTDIRSLSDGSKADPSCHLGLQNEKEESDFWDSHDSTEFMDSTEEVDMQFTDNRAAMKQISLRLEQNTINEIKLVAKQKGIGYQTLIRIWVIERLHGEAA